MGRGEFLNFHFICKELVLFLHKVDVLNDLFKELQLVRFNKANVLHVLAETLVAHIEAVFLDRLRLFEQTRQDREPSLNFLKWPQ